MEYRIGDYVEIAYKRREKPPKFMCVYIESIYATMFYGRTGPLNGNIPIPFVLSEIRRKVV